MEYIHSLRKHAVNHLQKHIRTLIRAAATIAHRVDSLAILDRESYVVIAFILLQTWAGSNKIYTVLIALYAIVLYIINRDIIKTLWIVFLSSFPFQQAKYFTSVFQSLTFAGTRPVVRTFFVGFADLFMMTLLYIMVRRRSHFKHIHITGTDALFVPLLIIGGISTFGAHFFSVALFGFFQMLKLFIFYLLGRILLKKRWGVKTTVEVYTIFILYNALLIIVQNIHGAPLGLPVETMGQPSPFGRYAGELAALYRPGGITDDPNAAATGFGMMIPMLTALGLTNKVLHKGFAWVTVFVATIALICTASRAVWIITGVLTVCTVFYIYRTHALRMPSFLTRYGRIILVFLIVCTTPFIYLRLSSFTQILNDRGSGTFRLIHLKIAADMAPSYPLGTGLGTTPFELANRFPPEFYMYDPSEFHNLFAELLGGLGVPGLFGFILLFTLIIKNLADSVRKRHNTVVSFGVLMITISYLAISNFYPWFVSVPISGFFWIMAGYTYE